MSLLGLFDGSNARRAAGYATGAANNELTTGYNNAFGTLARSRNDQLAALKSGYSHAMDAMNQGEATSAGYLNKGYDTARGDVGAGYDSAKTNVTDYYNRSQNLLNPYIQRGSTLSDLYSTALGGKGADAQRQFYSDYASNDPYREFRDEQANRAIMASMNARGQSNSGRANLAVSRASMERGSQDLQQYLDRLDRAGQQGGQYATTLAGLASQTGQTMGNLEARRGETLGNIETSRGGALAQNTGNYATQRGQYGYKFGADQAAAHQGYGQSQAALDYQVGQGRAGNHIGYGNAVAAANTGAANNLIGLGSALISGFTPGKSGISPVGNLVRTFYGNAI